MDRYRFTGGENGSPGRHTIKTTETTESSQTIRDRFYDSSYYSDSSFLEPEPCDLRPKTDYTYARTFIYRENPTLLEYISPNMSRRPIRGKVSMTPELKEFYSNMTDEEMEAMLGSSYTAEQLVRENHNNNARHHATYTTTHTSQSHAASRRRRDSANSVSGASEADKDAMVLRSGSRLHANHIEETIEQHNQRNTRAGSADRKSQSIMENNAIKQRLFNSQLSKNRNYNGWTSAQLSQSNSYQGRSASYNQGYTTVRKTLVEEFEETEYSKGSREDLSSKHAMSSRLSNGYLQKGANDKSAYRTTSVNHMYGLDSEEEYSDNETYDSYTTEKEFKTEEGEVSAMNTVTTTVVTTVTTTIETITSLVRPVVTPVWNTVGKPVWHAVSPLVYGVGRSLAWVISTLITLIGQVSVLDTWILSRIRRSKGACCLCLPLLLLLFLLPFLFTGVREMLAHYEKSVFVPPAPAQPVVPIVQNTSIFNFTMLSQEITRIMMLKNQDQGEQLSRGDVENIVRGILKEELASLKLNINEQYINVAEEIRNMQSESDGKSDSLGVKLDDIILKYEQLAIEIQDAKDSIRLDASQQNLTASRLKQMEEELSALRASFSNLDLNFQALSTSLRNCCRNSSDDLTGIRTHVNQILGQMVSDYGKDDGDRGGFMAWLRANFISQDHFQSQLKSLGEDLTLQMAAGSGTQGAMSETYLRKMIDTALWKFHSDKTGIADYALESAGGSVISVRCSKTYFRKTALFSVFGIPLWYISNSARTIIQPEMQPGECWPFEGKQGFVVLQLSSVITPTAFSLEHIPKSISPSGNIDSAPSDFTVIGLNSEADKVGVSLGNYTYSKEGSPLQYFPVQRPNPGPFRFIELRVLDNHGNKDFTCIYRFRVHGDPKV